MSNPFVVPGTDGKPVFVGREDPNNRPTGKPHSRNDIECPICNKMVEYLVGDDTKDGGRRGCEKCWKPGKGVQHEENQRTEETIFD